MNAAATLALATARRSKYNARKVKADGLTFDSKAEYLRYLVLRDMEAHGEINLLEVHPRFELLAPFKDWQGGKHKGRHYIADFRYEDRSGKLWVEDVKGARTQRYMLARDLFLSQYRHLCFREIPAGRAR